MKNNSLKLKSLRNAMLFVLLNLSISTFAQIKVKFAETTNALTMTSSIISDGVHNWKKLTITIPYFTDHLETFKFKTEYDDEGCRFPSQNYSMIRVNGNNSQYQSIHDQSKQPYYDIPSLAVGSYPYIIESLCNLSEIENSIERIIIEVVKEPTPILNLVITSNCGENAGVPNGFLNLHVSGSYANAKNIYIKAVNNTNSCITNQEYRLPTLSQNSALATNTINNNALFYSCNSMGAHTVAITYRNTSIVQKPIIRSIQNDLGWTSYSINKTVRVCSNIPIRDPRDVPFVNLGGIIAEDQSALTITNPVKEEVSLILSSDKNANYEVQIYDFSGLAVKRASFKDISSKTTNTINVQELKKGIYLMEITNGDSVIREKMIKE